MVAIKTQVDFFVNSCIIVASLQKTKKGKKMSANIDYEVIASEHPGIAAVDALLAE
jgi:hypothetical protein